MGKAFLAFGLIAAILSGILYFQFKSFFEPAHIPKLEEKWWGKGDPQKSYVKIRPFKIDISDEVRF